MKLFMDIVATIAGFIGLLWLAGASFIVVAYTISEVRGTWKGKGK